MQDLSRELITQAGGGDMMAFREIYQRASGFVYTLALRVTNRKHDAEEVTQDVFLKLYKNLRAFKFEASFKTWLYRIAVNTALNHIKKKGRVMFHEIEQENENIFSAPADAGRALEAEESERKLRFFLDQLNPDQRVCVVLREIEGLDYQAIAQNLGININTVRSRLKRGREALMTLAKKEVRGHEV